MAESALLKAVTSTIKNFSAMEPAELIGRLRDPGLVAKMKKFGVNDAQIHRMILILQEHKPDSKELVAYMKSKLV